MMGWGVLLPVGMMAARYFRRQEPYWFYGHMAIQGLGFAVGIVAVILGFRLNEDGLKNIYVHKAIGIAILSMTSLQVRNAAAAPYCSTEKEKPTTLSVSLLCVSVTWVGVGG